MTPNQLTRAAELAPDCPIIALALMLRLAEMPDGQATYEELATAAIPRNRVIHAMYRAWEIQLTNPRNDGVCLTAAGWRLVEVATGESNRAPLVPGVCESHRADVL